MPRPDAALSLACALAGFALFALLGASVSSRTPTRLDVEAVAIRGAATPLAAFFTRLGYRPALALIAAIAVAAFFGRVGPWWLTLALVASHTAAQTAIVLLKPLFHRTRPDYWLVRREVDTSYPSGHSATAITFYVALIVLVWHARVPQPVQVASTIALGSCALGIPWSRLALGAHYATDVLGGLLFGSAWLEASIALSSISVR